MKRTLNISVKETIRASKDKLTLDAYVLAYLIKASTRSSRINNPTARKMCSTFHISPKRYLKIKKAAIAIGYLKEEGSCIYAPNLLTNEEYVVPIDIKQETCKGSELKSAMSFKDMKIKLLAVIAQNHVRKQNDIENTYNRAHSGKDEHGNRISAQKVKNARKRLGRMSKTGCLHEGLSVARVAEMTNTSIYGARKIIKNLVLENKLKVEERIEVTDIPLRTFSARAKRDLNETHPGYSFFVMKVGDIHPTPKVVCRQSNKYHVVKPLEIRKVYGLNPFK